MGAWRDTYHNGREVDTSGELFRHGQMIEQFKDALLAEKPLSEGFRRASAVVAGPGTGAADSPVLEAIAAEAEKNDYRFQPLLKSIILGERF